jgi:hypothetical protein
MLISILIFATASIAVAYSDTLKMTCEIKPGLVRLASNSPIWMDCTVSNETDQIFNGAYRALVDYGAFVTAKKVDKSVIDIAKSQTPTDYYSVSFSLKPHEKRVFPVLYSALTANSKVGDIAGSVIFPIDMEKGAPIMLVDTFHAVLGEPLSAAEQRSLADSISKVIMGGSLNEKVDAVRSTIVLPDALAYPIFKQAGSDAGIALYIIYQVGSRSASIDRREILERFANGNDPVLKPIAHQYLFGK